jgi:hypothetical protein
VRTEGAAERQQAGATLVTNGEPKSDPARASSGARLLKSLATQIEEPKSLRVERMRSNRPASDVVTACQTSSRPAAQAPGSSSSMALVG